jgi:hypothetical protein
VTRRWVRYEMPLMVCVEISDAEEHEQITKVVLGVEADDIRLARDHDGHYLLYDEHMERVSADEPFSRQSLAAADDRDAWPQRPDWEEGPDALRDPWLYEDGDLDEDDEGQDKSQSVPTGGSAPVDGRR